MWIKMGAGSKPMIHLQISGEEIALLNINKAWDRMKRIMCDLGYLT